MTVNVLVDYGKSLSSDLKLQVDSCSLVTSTQEVPLFSNRVVNQAVNQVSVPKIPVFTQFSLQFLSRKLNLMSTDF